MTVPVFWGDCSCLVPFGKKNYTVLLQVKGNGKGTEGFLFSFSAKYLILPRSSETGTRSFWDIFSVQLALVILLNNDSPKLLYDNLCYVPLTFFTFRESLHLRSFWFSYAKRITRPIVTSDALRKLFYPYLFSKVYSLFLSRSSYSEQRSESVLFGT